jgi:hypothetical protein
MAILILESGIGWLVHDDRRLLYLDCDGQWSAVPALFASAEEAQERQVSCLAQECQAYVEIVEPLTLDAVTAPSG